MIDPVHALKGLVPLPSVTPLPTTLPTALPKPDIYQVSGDTGDRTLWVVFVIMAISSVAFYAMAFRVPAQKRLFHVLTAFITTFATISYFAMAVGDGISTSHIVVTDYKKHGIDEVQNIYRSVYWARYIDWTLTTPLLLLDLAFLAGLSGANILVAVVADLIMVLTGLFAAFSASNTHAQWGYYAIACIAYLVIVYQLAVHGRAQALAKDSKTGTFFQAIGAFTLILWTIYPIIWGIADGSRNIGVDAEIVSYAILDVLAKPVFGFWLLFTHDSMPQTQVSLDGFWAHGLSKDGSIRVGDDDEGA